MCRLRKGRVCPNRKFHRNFLCPQGGKANRTPMSMLESAGPGCPRSGLSAPPDKEHPMTNTRRLLIAVLAVVLAVPAARAQLEGEVKIDGSSTVYLISQAAASAFKKVKGNENVK